MDAQRVFEEIVSGTRHATIATASTDAVPEAATIFFAYRDGVFYFDTQTDYRKYANLEANPQAALAISNGSRTVQVQGIAEECADQSAAKRILDERRGKPSRFTERRRHFALKTTWIRVLVEPGPPSVFVKLLG